MKKILVTSLLATTTILLMSCGSKTAEVTTEKAETQQEQSSPSGKDGEASQKESVVGKRSNPVKLGESATFDTEYYDENSETIKSNVTMSISNVIRGEEAYNYLLNANQFNEPAPEGSEWILFDVSYKMNTGSLDDPMFVSPSMTPIASSGEEVPQDTYGTLNDGESFGDKDLYEGGTSTGKIAKLVPIGDNTLIQYDDWTKKVFFSLQ